MNDLTPVPQERGATTLLPDAVDLPVMSIDLKRLVDAVRGGRSPRTCAPDLREEARRLGPLYAGACQPVAKAVFVEWLRSINFASSAPVGPKEFVHRARALADVLASLPSGVITRQTRDQVAVELKFFPGAAEIAGALRDRVASLTSTLRAMRVIADLPSTLFDEPVVTEAQRREILARHREALAAMRLGAVHETAVSRDR